MSAIFQVCASFSQMNLDVLLDTHWIGGSPGKLEVYGWGAWNPSKGVLVLRNPNSKGQEFSFDVEKAFELPSGSAKQYEFKSPYKDQRIRSFKTRIGQSRLLKLEPFEVLVFDGHPDTMVESGNSP
jgi:hypothetical protein